jgi:hypothetical protein
MNAFGVLNAQPALSVMKLMVAQQEQRPGDKATVIGFPDAAPQEQARTAEASEDFYFGTQMTVTKLMYFMMDKIVGYLNNKLDVGRDGDPENIRAGEAWRDKALLDDTPINSGKDFTIPEPGKGGVSFGDVARTIKAKFNMGHLAIDEDLTRMLEKLIGFSLDGVSPADIIEAFADPDSKNARKVREAIEEGLAGQEGSKVAQRLERVAEGPKTVSEIMSEKGSPADVVDEETLEEDREALRVARMHEKLTDIRDTQDAIAETVKEREPADGRADPEDARRAIEEAIAVIEKLSDAKPEEKVSGSDTDISEIVAEDASSETAGADDAEARMEALEAEAEEIREEARSHVALADAYGEEPGDWREREDDEERVFFRI